MPNEKEKVLTKSILSSIPTYSMSLMHTPAAVMEKIKRIQRSFMWNTKKDKKLHLKKMSHLVSGKVVTSPISHSLWDGAKDLKVLHTPLVSKRMNIFDWVRCLRKTRRILEIMIQNNS